MEINNRNRTTKNNLFILHIIFIF
ncbi:hypothetical protein V1478_012691 [Vespula squamosa]|uniref:Uncharacterized protein n=1 Tax=Vespula squamosa TaxID=30214 RepID=A0ABD2A9B5_VESSQ